MHSPTIAIAMIRDPGRRLAFAFFLTLPLALCLRAAPAAAGEVQVAVAANFAGPMQAI
ncbi:MAG: hypothetical protein JO243_10565, partial [Solirubrobacterales bacterium]|nr:hypothetical protein [Solirubrobacterales bacterium]